MRTQIIRIGNSRGVRLPKLLIEQAGFEDEVELKVVKGKITISKPEQPRQGWAKAAAQAAARNDDQLPNDYTPTNFDETEWKW